MLDVAYRIGFALGFGLLAAKLNSVLGESAADGRKSESLIQRFARAVDRTLEVFS